MNWSKNSILPLFPKAIADVLYTTGTTGRSKGVMISHRTILWPTPRT